MKKGDIITYKVLDKTYKGKVNWVDEENVGITLIGPEYDGKAATVMPISDCKVVIEFKGDALREKIHNLETEELIASIQRLKGMRLPRKMKGRARSASTSPSKRQRMTKLLEVLEGDPDALDALIEKALKDDEGVKHDKDC